MHNNIIGFSSRRAAENDESKSNRSNSRSISLTNRNSRVTSNIITLKADLSRL